MASSSSSDSESEESTSRDVRAQNRDKFRKKTPSPSGKMSQKLKKGMKLSDNDSNVLVSKFNLELSIFNELLKDSAYLDIQPVYERITSIFEEIRNNIDGSEESCKSVQALFPKWNEARRQHDKKYFDYIKSDIAVKAEYAKVSAGEKETRTGASSKSSSLKRLDCPKWDGTVSKYFEFKKLFKLLVEKDESPERALWRLKQEAIIQDSRPYLLVRSKETITLAWEALDEVFAKPAIVKDSCLIELQSLPAVSDISDCDGLLFIVSKARSILEDLQNLGKQDILGDTGLAILLTKVPDKIRRKVNQDVIDADLESTPSIKLLLKKCERYAITEERDRLRMQAQGLVSPGFSYSGTLNVSTNLQSGSSSGQTDNPQGQGGHEPTQGQGQGHSGKGQGQGRSGSGPGQGQFGRSRGQGQGQRGRGQGHYRGRGSSRGHGSFGSRGGRGGQSDRDNSGPRKFCLYHPNGVAHWTNDCRDFVKVNAADKKKLLVDKKHCLRCFRNHEVTSCPADHMKCNEPNCKDPSGHHTMLHAVCMVTQCMTNSCSIDKEPVNEREKSDLLHHLGRCTIRPSHPVLLPPAKCTKKEPPVKAMLLYDPGATLSQVVESLAQQIGLKPINRITNLMMSVAGKDTPESWGSANLYKLPLYDGLGTLTAILQCVGVPYIGELDNGNYDAVAKLFPDLDKSKLLPPASGQIQILVGNNQAPLFPQMIECRGNVVWAESRFGDILHGSHELFKPIARHDATGIGLSSFMSTVVAKSYVMSTGLGQKLGTFMVDARRAQVPTVHRIPVNSDIRDDAFLGSVSVEHDSVTQVYDALPGTSSADRDSCSDVSGRLHGNNIATESTDIRLSGQDPESIEVDVGTCSTSQRSSDDAHDDVTVTQLANESAVEVCQDTNLQSGKVFVTKDDNAFELMSKIEEEPICYKCEKCPLGAKAREEERLIETYRNCLTYDSKNKRFICRMPWKQDFKEVPDNRELALKRMYSFMKSALNDLNFRDSFVKEFDKMIDDAILVPVTHEEDRQWHSSGGKVWYICYFAVKNEASSSTPLRVIMDPTIPFRGVVINSMWEKPPNMIPPIASLIIGFQERPVPFFLDFKKCYWTLGLELEESHLHRVVYNHLDPDQEVKTYRMTRNSWGCRPAGAMCSIAMLEVSSMYKDSHPHVYDFIRRCVYVDDGTTSVDTVNEALVLARDISHVMSHASFEVKHFVIGGKDVDIAGITASDQMLNVKPAQGQERILGIMYHSDTDEISINARINFSNRRKGARTQPDVEEADFDEKFPIHFTKKMYLAIMASLYDPCGLCSAATILLKYEYGKICALQIDWKDVIPDGGDELKTSWSRCKELIRTIYDIKKLRFARCLRPGDAEGEPSLVIFCDSSQTAYAVVAFFSWKCKDVRRSVIVMAKARPFPSKQVLTIPRGEMMACVLAARVQKYVLESTSYNVKEIILVTDSMIVLGQLRHSPMKYNLWTANRLDEIQRLTKVEDWRHVASKLNIADDATRGLSAAEMGRQSRWQSGEQFMQEPDISKWPLKKFGELTISQDQQSTDIRIKDPRMTIRKPIAVPATLAQKVDISNLKDDVNVDMSVINVIKPRLKPLDPNDSWIRAKRRVARAISFVVDVAVLYKRVKIRKQGRLKVDLQTMTSHARSTWFSTHDRYVPSKREMHLAAVILVLQAQEDLPEDVLRSFSQLNPVQDQYGIWRVQGRTKQAKENPPILLPKNSPLSLVLVKYYHSPLHSGADTTIAKMRQEFWPIDGLRLANKFTSRCSPCKLLRKEIARPEMAPKKIEQITRSPVFENVTLDYAGPYKTKADRRTTRNFPVDAGQVWVLCIVCRVTSAVHLEVVDGYDTDNFLSAFQTFVDTRGKPSSVVADLGSQIKAASGVIESLWTYVKKHRLENYQPDTIRWEFVPSGAHSDLGQAERTIQAFKKAMEAVTRSRSPSLEKLKFQRLLYSIASLMNDRPLSIGRNNAGKLDADRMITANDLIIGRCKSQVTPLIDCAVDMTSDQRKYTEIIRKNEQILDEFWRAWSETVAHTLFPKEKWTRPGRNVTIGDIVVMRDSGKMIRSWSLGEVADVERSSDQVVRKATVRYKLKNQNCSNSQNYIAMKSKFVVKSVRDLAVILPAEDRDDSK